MSSLLILFLVGCDHQPELKQVKIVVDGDTVILEGEEALRLDLAYVDAPEREQPFGKESKQYIKDLLNSGEVSVLINDSNQVELQQNNQSINILLVEQGFAWASPNISDPIIATRFIEAQKSAVNHLSGLWGLGHRLRVAPWQWRQQGKQKYSRPPNQYQKTQKRLKNQQKTPRTPSNTSKKISPSISKTTKGDDV